MDLCTLEGVKTLIKIDADNTDNDDVITSLISAVSQAAENYMRRSVETTTYTEYFTVKNGDILYSLKAYPVTSITSVHNDTTWGWAANTLVSSDNYTSTGDGGLLYIDTGMLVSGYHALRVIYTGGMASSTEELLVSYADLVHAIERQVAFFYKTRTKIGAQAVNSNTGGVSWETGIDWLKEVKATLDMYRRRNV